LQDKIPQAEARATFATARLSGIGAKLNARLNDLEL
jgi:hypothetical protein